MKVLFVSNLLYRYGPPITLFRLIHELNDTNMALLSYLDGPMKKDFEVIGIHPIINNLYDVNIENIKAIMNIIKEEKVDLVVTNTVDCINATFAAHLSKVPQVLYVHADYPQINTSLLHMFAFKLSDLIIFSSEYQRNVYYPILGKTPIALLRNGIPFNKFNAQFIPESREEILVSNNLPKNKKVVSIIGTVCDRKRQELLIFAAQEILKKRDDVIFLIIGRYHKDRLYDKLLKKYIDAGKLGNNIFILDEKENIDRYIFISDAIVCCSGNDVTPSILLEALAMKKPVIAPNIDGISNIIHDGHNGILFERNDQKVLEDAILKVLNSPEHFEKYILKERPVFKAKYDVREIAKQFEKLIKKTKLRKKKYSLKLNGNEISFVAKQDTLFKFRTISPYVGRKSDTFRSA